MKTAITLRVDPKLLSDVRECARRENRTLTNFIETVLLSRVNTAMPDRADDALPLPATRKSRSADA